MNIVILDRSTVLGSFSSLHISCNEMSTFSPEINLLRRQFLQLLDPSALNVPESQVLKRPEIQNQIYALMFRDDSLQYSPPSRYRLRVLKLLVTALENAMDDPDEDVGIECSHYFSFDSVTICNPYTL